jgi:hypothetical protein
MFNRQQHDGEVKKTVHVLAITCARFVSAGLIPTVKAQHCIIYYTAAQCLPASSTPARNTCMFRAWLLPEYLYSVSTMLHSELHLESYCIQCACTTQVLPPAAGIWFIAQCLLVCADGLSLQCQLL